MAKPDVRMVYESMEKMAKEFDNSASQLEETMNDMKKIAQMMEGGALVGDGGSAFQDAIKSQLLPNIKILMEKLQENGGDIRAAVAYKRDGVEDARMKFT